MRTDKLLSEVLAIGVTVSLIEHGIEKKIIMGSVAKASQFRSWKARG